jgi:hypothetical protein
MEDIRRFAKTKEAKLMTALFVINILLFFFGIFFDVFMKARFNMYDPDTAVDFSYIIDLLLIFTAMFINSIIAQITASLLSGIGKHISLSKIGPIVYINDGMKKRIRVVFSLLAILVNSVTETTFDTHDEESFTYARNMRAKFKLMNLLAFNVIAVIFLAVSFTVTNFPVLHQIIRIFAVTAQVCAVFYSYPRSKKTLNLANYYIRYKNDELLSTLEIEDGLLFVTRYQFDPVPVRNFYWDRICRVLSDPNTNPDLTFSMALAENLFLGYTAMGRTDYPKIIRDYFEYYIANIDRLFTPKTQNQDRQHFIELLYYLAATGRREQAVDEYNKRISYLLPVGNTAQYLNGCLRYILFNEDYSLWLYDRKNIQPTSIPFLHKWFEVPYINEARIIDTLHKLVWERTPHA